METCVGKGMKFIKTIDFKELSYACAEKMINCVKQKPNALLCLASGNSPKKAYEIFVKRILEEKLETRQLRILKLDEWWGISNDDPSSCEMYLQEILIKPLNISKNQFISFESSSANAHEECYRISEYLRKKGPIDLCVLGLGKNGHLGLNEPAAFLKLYAHVVELDNTTKTHTMLKGNDTDVSLGITIGLGEIMASQDILFVVTGEQKEPVFDAFKEGIISTKLPASFLWLHPKTTCIHDL